MAEDAQCPRAAHYPGYFWSATMGAHVVYESRLELARLLLADFDRHVAAIAAQPFLLRARVGGQARRHVPDFLLVHADNSVRVVNVKPAGRLADPRIAEALAWPGQLIRAQGWEHEIWSGADPVLLANLRFLAGYRRPACCRRACWRRFSPRSCRRHDRRRDRPGVRFAAR